MSGRSSWQPGQLVRPCPYPHLCRKVASTVWVCAATAGRACITQQSIRRRPVANVGEILEDSHGMAALWAVETARPRAYNRSTACGARIAARGTGILALGQGLWPLAAYFFWAGAFSLVFFFLLHVSRVLGEWHRVCDLGGYYLR